jgi:isopentenyldiphosphate isomerase
MENELLKIFDDNSNHIGFATRDEVHRLGLWHETFHCWFINKEEGTDYLYLQLRSQTKKDYPNLLDITAAGHLMANETVEDGIREIKEEIGIDISFDKLVPLGIISYCARMENFIDKELAHTYLYHSEISFDDFTLQVEEVAGIVKVEFNHFVELWNGKREIIKISGFEMTDEGNKVILDESVGKEKFVPHDLNFYQTVIEKMKKTIYPT